jgi:hypothetical protein
MLWITSTFPNKTGHRNQKVDIVSFMVFVNELSHNIVFCTDKNIYEFFKEIGLLLLQIEGLCKVHSTGPTNVCCFWRMMYISGSVIDVQGDQRRYTADMCFFDGQVASPWCLMACNFPVLGLNVFFNSFRRRMKCLLPKRHKSKPKWVKKGVV